MCISILICRFFFIGGVVIEKGCKVVIEVLKNYGNVVIWINV